MSRIGTEMPKEYSDRFDELRQNRIELGFYKYGPAEENYRQKLVNALESMELCVDKYRKTKNTEYLCDAANYLMLEFMYPQLEGAYFKATDSSGSAGQSGMSINEMKRKYY